MLNQDYYIYRHIRPDTNEVFYIGKGNIETKSHGVRHLEKSGRNKWWKSIVAKNNGIYKSEIIFFCDTEEEVNQKEIEFIKIYGRANLGEGTLCNLTDGAEGTTGLKVSDETKKILSDMFSGENHPNYGKKLSQEICNKKSESMKRSDKNLKGKKLPEWWKDKIRQAKIGDKNHRFGKTGALSCRSRKVIDSISGEVYVSVSDAAEKTGYKMKTLYNILSGHRQNSTTLKFA